MIQVYINISIKYLDLTLVHSTASELAVLNDLTVQVMGLGTERCDTALPEPTANSPKLFSISNRDSVCFSEITSAMLAADTEHDCKTMALTIQKQHVSIMSQKFVFAVL